MTVKTAVEILDEAKKLASQNGCYIIQRQVQHHGRPYQTEYRLYRRHHFGAHGILIGVRGTPEKILALTVKTTSVKERK